MSKSELPRPAHAPAVRTPHRRGAAFLEAIPRALWERNAPSALYEGFAAAVARPGAWTKLLRGLLEVLGGPEISYAGEAVWRCHMGGSESGTSMATRTRLRSELQALTARRRKCAVAIPQASGARLNRWSAVLEGIERRARLRERSLQGMELPARRSFNRATMHFHEWGASRAATEDGRRWLDEQAHALAVRLVLGTAPMPASVDDFRDALEACSPVLTRAEGRAVEDLEALERIDGIVRQCSDAARLRTAVGPLWPPGRRDPRRAWAQDCFSAAESPLATPRARALAATAGTGLLVLDAHEIPDLSPPSASTRDMRTVLRGARVPPSVCTLLMRAWACATSPGDAHAVLLEALRMARKLPDKLRRNVRRERDSEIVPAAEQRLATGLYLAADQYNIDLGDAPLRYRLYRGGAERPVSVGNEVGRLLWWLAQGKRGCPAGVHSWARTALAQALKNAGGALSLRGRGADLHLAPLPAVVDEVLRDCFAR